MYCISAFLRAFPIAIARNQFPRDIFDRNRENTAMLFLLYVELTDFFFFFTDAQGSIVYLMKMTEQKRELAIVRTADESRVWRTYRGKGTL